MYKRAKRSGKFVWTLEAINVLITLYGENIKNFLNPCKVQVKLWRKLVELMKEDDSIPSEIRDVLTPPIAQRKWMSLQKDFKAGYYSYVKQSTFPFYDKMYQLFTEYATDHLNSTYTLNGGGDSMNQTTPAEVTAFVEDLLNKSVPDSPDILRCDTSKENKFKHRSSLNESNSEASKVRKQLAKMPKEFVSIQEAKMRILPNTPFNRRYQLSTIINHRNSVISSFKRSHVSDTEFKASKRLSLSPEPTNEISIIETADDSNRFEVEALDECDLSEVHHDNFVKPVWFNRSVVNASDIAVVEEETRSILEVPSFDFDPVDQLREVPETRVVLKKSTGSSFNSPSIGQSFLKEPLFEHSVIEELNDLPKTRIISKKSNGGDEIPQVDHSSSTQNEPPTWFKEFLNRYSADIKRIDAKMEQIDGKLNKVLAQRPSTLTHQNIVRMKQER